MAYSPPTCASMRCRATSCVHCVFIVAPPCIVLLARLHSGCALACVSCPPHAHMLVHAPARTWGRGAAQRHVSRTRADTALAAAAAAVIELEISCCHPCRSGAGRCLVRYSCDALLYTSSGECSLLARFRMEGYLLTVTGMFLFVVSLLFLSENWRVPKPSAVWVSHLVRSCLGRSGLQRM